jgi:hypothetical protein
MSETTFEKVKKTAGDVVHRLGEFAQNAGERLSEMQEAQRIAGQIRTLRKERDRCKNSMVDLVMRMFDEGVFVEVLLKREYTRIKEIDAEIVVLEAEKAAVGEMPTPAPQPASEMAEGPAEETQTDFLPEEPAEEALTEPTAGKDAP